jgi:hypothetical protein
MQALQAGPASRRRKRASLYQPVVLGFANKVAAAVMLSVNRVGQRTTEHRAAPRQAISKRSNVAGVTEGEGLEKVAAPRLGWGGGIRFGFGSEMCDMAHGALVEKESHSRCIDECVPKRARAKL